MFWFNYISSDLNPPTLISLLCIPFFINNLFIGFRLIKWRETILFARLKSKGINKLNILMPLLVIFVQIYIISFFCNVAAVLIFCKIPTGEFNTISTFVFDRCREQFIAYAYIFTIIGMIFLIVLNIGATSLIVFAIKHHIWSRTILIVYFIVTLIFSDVVMNTQLSTQYTWFQIIGYFIPQKYGVWFLMLITSYTRIDHLGIYQMVYLYGGFKPFTDVYQAAIGLFITLTSSLVGAYFLFTTERKG
jgi:hypothetical protein